jgi:hypothetical protein
MSNKFEFVVTVNGKENRVDIPYTSINDLVYTLPDVKENTKVFEALINHTSIEALASLASKENLSNDIFQKLILTGGHKTKVALLNNRKFRKEIKLELLKKWVMRDTELALTAGFNANEFDEIDPKEIVELLIKHPDPEVINQLIESSSLLSKASLKKLTTYPDNKIAMEAIKKIQELDGENT